MLQIRSVVWIFTVLSVAYSSENEDIPSRTTRQLREFSNIQNSRGFEYRIKDEELRASHFRKEERDQNGVVRGSYGLRDPNGSFRLVRYIADDKGFRVDISSNEPGVGRQSPANVDLNRFSHSSQDRKPENTIIHQFDNQDGRDISERQNWPSNYDFYVPLRKNKNSDESSRRKSTPLDLHKHLFNVGFYNQPPVPKRNVQQGLFPWKMHHEKDKTDSNIQDTGEESLKHLDGNDFRIWPRIPVDTPNLTPVDITTNTEMGNSGAFPSHYLNDDIPLTRENKRINKPSKSPSRISPTVLHLLLNYPQQKVHTDLPDCETVSSAVLCKPPLFYTNNYAYFNLTQRKILPLGEQQLTDSYRLSPDERKFLIEAALAERLQKFISSGESDIDLNSLPLQNNAFNLFTSIKDASHKSTPCSDSKKKNEKDAEDLDLTNTLNRPVIYNTISNTHINSLMKYGNDWNRPLPANNAQQNNQNIHPQYSSESNRDINSENLDGFHDHKKLVLLTPQNSEKSENSFLDILKNLNVLGLIILPKDDRQSQDKLIEQFVRKAANEQSEENISKNITNKLIKNATEEITMFTPEFSNTTRKENDKISNSSEYLSENITSKPFNVIAYDRNEPIHKLLKNSEFLILDDTRSPESGDYGLTTTVKSETPTDAPNWRKVFEDEMKQEYERTSNKNLSDDESMLSLSSNRGIPNERVYSIPDPPIPLYDSRGIPVKSENVPLHLHRYVAPTGIPSLPWKFSIPRYAPPRSLVIPPKPSD
ncbi:cuticle protein 14 isoform b [Nephila pilipes]|uniref:Cuticle protein 14 isoform b n=1 Tax=Nephila pilipes TaxID=299642 RepID=A0A8X6TR69_NEPPI|nr:cuticle protein 14 isoform b [Nephila pilipes]